MQPLQQLLSAVFGALRDQLAAAGLPTPPWLGAALALSVVVLLSPRLLRSVRLSQARAALSRAKVASAATLQAEEDRAVDRVWDHPVGLEIIAVEAAAIGRRALAERCLARLEALAAPTAARARVRRVLAPPSREPQTAMAAAVLVAGLLERGEAEAAQRQLEAALRRWPSDPALSALATPVEPG
ncbi:MAG: hypothetical protein JNM72_26585 [Deltaproteobacteria bacterium]|nr:hypothetical protein [Deltaproteobacteria bacterium]